MLYLPDNSFRKARVTNHLAIILVEPDRDKANQIVDSLAEAGFERIQVITEASSLKRQIQAMNPDIVLIDMANPSRDMLEEMAVASQPMDRAVAVFVDRSDDALTSAAIEAGVSAYFVDGLRPAPVNPVLGAASARFNVFPRLRTALAGTTQAW